ncbi:MAG: hypothetical protein JKY10_02835, partial [Cohaesibacteraceae bacterium]|nr:hypothetical protein [Cohaesibacteraceae bacterium]
WKISCGADQGSIVKKGDTWTFKTSSNRCTGGIFKQRAEIKSGDVRPTIKGTYRFSSTISMNAQKRQKFDIFQIHDGRSSCAPPLKVTVHPTGRIKLDSHYRTTSRKCEINSSISGGTSAKRLSFNGKKHLLQIDISFDGKGGFGVIVRLDGKQQIKGQYNPPQGKNYFKSKRFYFKHGVYSRHPFEYVMTSGNMSVKKIK